MRKETVSISKIKNNPNNPRLIKDDKFEKLVTSIKEFPEMLEAREIVVNEDYIILGGNMRFKAAKEAGLKELPVKVVSWTEDQQRQFVIKDNVSGGEWDWDQLANEWDSEELDAWGLDLPDKWGEEAEIEEDEAPEVDEKEPPKSKLGEIYQLGRHRVMCGDSTDKDAVSKLMDGKKAQVVLTDPPYGIDVVKGGSIGKGVIAKEGTYAPIMGDDKEFDCRFILDLNLAPLVMLFGGNYFSHNLPKSTHWIVWNKRAGDEDDTNFSDCELIWTNDSKNNVKLYTHIWAGMFRAGNKIDELQKRVHPTQKPVGLLESIVRDYSKEEDIIVDLFGGSGSTLIACENKRRSCYMMELSPAYVDVIRKRYHKFVTGDEKGWEEATKAVSV